LSFVPSAFTAFTGAARWKLYSEPGPSRTKFLLSLRISSVKSAKSFECHGHSMIVDPWGKVLAELADGAGIIAAEIDLDYLAKVRAELPALKHRRLS